MTEATRPFVLRPAAEADAAALARLNELFNGATLSPAEQAEHLRAAASTERAVLAWVDGRAVGFRQSANRIARSSTPKWAKRAGPTSRTDCWSLSGRCSPGPGRR